MEHQDSNQSLPDAHETQHSHLFTLRLWEEQLGGGEAEWRGRVQDITTGETHYFRDWPGLVVVLTRLVAADPGIDSGPGPRPSAPS